MELIRLAQGGEEQAYGRLFERYYERVHAIVRKRLGQALRADVESLDIVQDAMVDAGVRLSRIRSAKGRRTW